LLGKNRVKGEEPARLDYGDRSPSIERIRSHEVSGARDKLSFRRRWELAQGGVRMKKVCTLQKLVGNSKVEGEIQWLVGSSKRIDERKSCRKIRDRNYLN